MLPEIEHEVVSLQRMTAKQLQRYYAELFGEESRSAHKTYLIRKIAWRLQSQAEGDLSIRARRRAAELANDAEVRVTPPKDVALPLATNVGTTIEVPLSHDKRLPPPGTSLVRQYKGRKIQVNILQDGFEYDGERYPSLSAVAKMITGSHCNGFRFFQLGANA